MKPPSNQWLSVDIEYNTSDKSLHGVGIYDGVSHHYLTDVSDKKLISDLLNANWIVGHNFKSDLHILKLNGVIVDPSRLQFDTMTLAYNSNPRELKLGLKPLTKKYLDKDRASFKDIFGTTDLKHFDLDKVVAYNKDDCVDTWNLWCYYVDGNTVNQLEYFNKLEMPITRLIYEMEDKGIKVDVEYLKTVEPKMWNQIVDMKKDIQNQVGPISVYRTRKGVKSIVTIDLFNPNSPVQKVAALNKLGIKVKGSDKKKDLNAFKHMPFVKVLQEYNKIKDCYQKYITALPKWIDNDGRIHPQFNQTTITGRLSSRNPNMQNVEAHEELGKTVRTAFIAREGHSFIGSDYSQIDSRVLAHFSQDPVWLHVFNNPALDLHQETADEASRLTGIKITRQVGKTINHASGYGAGPKALALLLECSTEKAGEFLNAVKKALKVLEAWKVSVQAEVAKKGGVETLMGRFVKLPEIYSSDFKIRGYAARQAISVLGQGGTAEIVKLAMLRMQQQQLIPLAQEHDSLLFEVLDGEVESTIPVIKEGMEGAYKLDGVPLKVDIKIGKTWADVK